MRRIALVRLCMFAVCSVAIASQVSADQIDTAINKLRNPSEGLTAEEIAALSKELLGAGPPAIARIRDSIENQTSEYGTGNLLHILGMFGDADSYPFLARYARHPTPTIRFAAYSGLSASATPESVSLLFQLFREAPFDTLDRHQISRAIVKYCKADSALPALELALQQSATKAASNEVEEQIANLSAHALGNIGSREALNTLTDVAASSTAVSVRVSAVDAIASINPESAISLLESMESANLNNYMEEAIASKLAVLRLSTGKIANMTFSQKGEAAQSIFQIYDSISGDRSDLYEAIAQYFRDPIMINYLLQIVDETNSNVAPPGTENRSIHAVELLGGLQSFDAIPAIADLLENSDSPRLRQAAALALTNIDPEIAGALLQDRMQREDDAQTQILIEEHLRKIEN